MSDGLERLAGRCCRVRVEPLHAPRSPAEVVRALGAVDGLVCLWGDWAGGGALLTWAPEITCTDPDALAVAPAVLGGTPAVVGGGWFGRLGYDAATTVLAFHDHVLRWQEGRWTFESLHSDERAAALAAARRRALAALSAPPAPSTPSAPPLPLQFEAPDPQVHLAAVEQAIGLIRAGELYQVNVCTRLAARAPASARELFDAVSERIEPAFGALLDGPDRGVLSLSPELFLRRQGRQVTTSPIKGTLPRVPGDEANAAALRRSAKDGAENVMIVDLMRNDLGRVCETGSVRVAQLLGVEPHPGVWHLVSTVAGTLRADVDDAALLRATFPPGSVTGAPKHRAVSAIESLEAAPRGTYTGAIGFASPSWGLELSVAIRTFELAAGRIELGVGGGVTADSVPVLEWQECLHKADPLLQAVGGSLPPDRSARPARPTAAQLSGGLLETMLAVDGRILRLADHLARLDRSCRELYGTGLPDDVAPRVTASARGSAGRVAVRVLARPAVKGLAVTLSCAPAPVRTGPDEAVVLRRPPGSWRHKWADRSALTAAEAAGAASPLFVAGDGTVLETSRGNVFLLLDDGTLVTPPLREDLLPGVTRRALLDLHHDHLHHELGRPAQVRPFAVAELHAAAAVFWTSSLSGLVPIAAVDGVPLRRADALLARWQRRLGFG